MTLASLLLLTGALFLLAATPGPGVLAVVARALASGPRAAALVVVGIVLGDLAFLLLAIYGLGVLALALGELSTVVKYLGAVYLVWLGVRLWLGSPTTAAAATETRDTSAHLLSGLAITLSNPKVILFYLGFLPTFVDLRTLSDHEVLLLAALVSGVLGVTLMGYLLAAAKAGSLLRSERARRRINRAAGTALIAVGGTLASQP